MNRTWLTAQEAAEYLGVSVDYIHTKTTAGDLPHYKVNARLVRYRADELDEWMGQYRVMSNTEVKQAAMLH